jgi:hypothetical protein
MAADSAFQSYLQGALEVWGIEADETERAVMTGIYGLYEPALELLRSTDLSDVRPEENVDLSSAPTR